MRSKSKIGPATWQMMLLGAIVYAGGASGIANDGRSPVQSVDVGALQDQIYSTIDRVRPAVVLLSSGRSVCSGVIVSQVGHVLSAGHAIEPGESYRITLASGRRVSGIGQGSSGRLDCALVKITDAIDDLPFAEMGDSSQLVVNQPCLSLSFPGGQKAGGEPMARFGRIAKLSGRGHFLQSTALMEPGDSGGGLFDLSGRVIGIHSRVTTSMEHNYEVPIDVFRDFWSELNRPESFDRSGPPRPRLGVRLSASNRGDENELRVVGLVDDGIAKTNGIKLGDVLHQVHGRRTTTAAELRSALIAARDDGSQLIVVQLHRGEKDVELTIPFDVQRLGAPAVALPKYDRINSPLSDLQRLKIATDYRELADFPKHFSELESNLDDACLKIISTLGNDQSVSVIGTIFKDTRWVVSKSSRIGREPEAVMDGQIVELKIIRRDNENDLIILQSPEVFSRGVVLDSPVDHSLPVGQFLIVPDVDGDGLVGIVGTRRFRSRKQQSRGFLGVVPLTYQGDGGAILAEVIEDGAANRAGLRIGDVITRLDDRNIQTQQDVRQFLSRVDPNMTITATVLRDEDEMTKSIFLGAFPSKSNHAAEQMAKSGRRDGFESVIHHDADLRPEDCGGPVFDLEGRFIGINIARNSRVRSYALPATIVSKLIDGLPM